MKKSVIAFFKAPLPPAARIMVKGLIGFPVPTDSDYELNAQQALRHLLRPGQVVFDIGANVGELSVIMSRLVGADGHVYAFEANPSCGAQLKKTLRLNRVRNCTIVLAAVCDRSDQTVRLYSDERPGMHGVASSLLPSWPRGGGPTREYTVPAVTLDEFCSLHRISPGLVKIDVEGVELAVLEGFRHYLETSRPHVILEARSDGTGRCDDPLHFLEKLGYGLSVPGPWRWVTADQFAAQLRSEPTVVAIHRDQIKLIDSWIG